MPPAFIYFDLGNVLLTYDHHQATRQMAEVAGADEGQVWQTLFGSGLQRDYELGEMNSQRYYEIFCQRTKTLPDFVALLEAANVFTTNVTMVPLVAQLEAAGYRLGLLSNTNPSHWEYCANQNYWGNSHGSRFGTIPAAFEITVLSYEVHLLKPDLEIYRLAAQRAEVSPEAIFFTDDLIENVEAARQVGFDAVLYTGTVELYRQLRQRGVRCNL